MSELSLADVLSPPTVLCTEAGASGRFPAFRQRRSAGRTLGLLVTARSAFGRPIARLFVTALAQRLPLCPRQKDHIHTGLPEALGMAVLHGSLGVGSRLFDGSAGLEATRRMIDSRLASDDPGLS